jgi:hypothetical protein
MKAPGIQQGHALRPVPSQDSCVASASFEWTEPRGRRRRDRHDGGAARHAMSLVVMLRRGDPTC